MSEDKNYYLDTCALLPYYRNESTSHAVQSFLFEIEPQVLISSLTWVEFASAIARWVRMIELTEAEASLIENAFNNDVLSGLFICQTMSLKHFQLAEKWISSRRTSLRTMDALHLAICWSLGAKMITSDSMLHKSATLLGVNSWLLK